jgi:hypothetical protein
MFEAIRSIATEYLRTHEVSLHKDPARNYGQRERQGAGGVNRGRSEAAVVTVGNEARALARRAPDQGSVPPFGEVLRNVRGEQSRPSIDVLGRAVQASAEPFVNFGAAANPGGRVVPYDALRFAAASQDPTFASEPLLRPFNGLPLPLLGDEATSIYDQHGADDDDRAFAPSARASEPFGRTVPFDLQNPDGEDVVEGRAVLTAADPAPKADRSEEPAGARRASAEEAVAEDADAERAEALRAEADRAVAEADRAEAETEADRAAADS